MEEEKTGPKQFRIVSGAHSVSKAANTTCEDAHFISDRAFGVADGVSGWNDYGFSSSAFSNSLMDNCKSEILTFDK